VVARREAERQRRGNAQHAGAEIEPYLAVFREALNRNCESDRFSDLAVGYQWCGAFVYYCCLQAGFRFSPKPAPGYRYTLAAVPAWHYWAVAEGFFHPTSVAAPEAGDIALFNHVATGEPLDHMGVVIEVQPDFVLCAEGNHENRTGLFERPHSCVAGYVRLPEPREWTIASVPGTSEPGCDLVRQWLREYNWAVNPEFMRELQQPGHQARPLVLLACVGSEVAGGILAETQLAWLRISIMAVNPAWRSRGIGAALLAEAEQQAVARGCRHAYVDTMEYQGPRFYQAHGFEIAGQIPDWDSRGHAKLHFTKRLAGSIS